ncbi:MAG: PUR family DNA/RNA-binding protein [Bacteroidales bacterium]|nr:PUR family DNA/RNA-binding protein [Bacteroidales bacterium]
MDEQMTDGAKKFRENIFTSSVKAGKRTYYFDVKETKSGERYITVTERKRRYNEDGSYKVEKHKIFLYKEDFDKFADALDDVIEFVETGKMPEKKEDETEVKDKAEEIKDEFTDVKFEDLDD